MSDQRSPGWYGVAAHPDSPEGGTGPGYSRIPGPTRGAFDGLGYSSYMSVTLAIHGVIVAGGQLSTATIIVVNAAAARIPEKWHRYIAYEGVVKVGGSLAWRANNPGNLRDAPTKIGSVPGASGSFAVFPNLATGWSAQRDLYLKKYGTSTVRDAITALTPPTENDTAAYLADLEVAGVALDKDVKSQIDIMMSAVQSNEGLIEGIEVLRVP
jgi:hypothetical protein